MNIKALVYSRYSTSVKIHTIIREESNQPLCKDIDKVNFILNSFHKKPRL